MRNFVDSLGGRKFVFAEILVVILAVMIAMKVETASIETFFNYAVTIFGIFVGGDVAQKFSKNVVAKSKCNGE